MTEISDAAITLRESPSGKELSHAARMELLADVRGNPASTARLTFEAVTFIQGGKRGERPNANAVRVRDGGLLAAARSFKGQPFLRDHDSGELSARGGTIVESALETRDDGSKVIRQVVELSKPWAIEGVLDGTIDRFSVGLAPVGSISCTLCNKPARLSFFGAIPSCEHRPGEVYELKSGEKQTAELEFENASGKEVSAVSIPAVAGTSIESVRAQLAAELRGNPETLRELFELASGSHMFASLTREESPMDLALLTALGLSADADSAAVLSAVEKLQTSREGDRAALEDIRGKYSALETRVAAQEKAGRDKAIATCVELALTQGRFPLNSKAHAHAIKLAERGDLDGLEAFVSDFEPGAGVPVSGAVARQSMGTDPTPRNVVAVTLTADDKNAAKRLGVTDEEFARHKADYPGSKPAV